MILNLEKARQLKDQTGHLFEEWMAIHESQEIPLHEVQLLTEKTLKGQSELIKLSQQNIWTGWLSYTLLVHVQEETEYFYKKIFGGEAFTYQTEIPFWLWHADSETAYSGQLLDASEEELREKGNLFVKKVRALQNEAAEYQQGQPISMLPEVEAALREFFDTNVELLDKIKGHQVLTNLNVDLVNHVIRKAIFGDLVFEWLSRKNQRQAIPRKTLDLSLKKLELL